MRQRKKRNKVIQEEERNLTKSGKTQLTYHYWGVLLQISVYCPPKFFSQKRRNPTDPHKKKKNQKRIVTFITTGPVAPRVRSAQDNSEATPVAGFADTWGPPNNCPHMLASGRKSSVSVRASPRLPEQTIPCAPIVTPEDPTHERTTYCRWAQMVVSPPCQRERFLCAFEIPHRRDKCTRGWIERREEEA